MNITDSTNIQDKKLHFKKYTLTETQRGRKEAEHAMVYLSRTKSGVIGHEAKSH